MRQFMRQQPLFSRMSEEPVPIGRRQQREIAQLLLRISGSQDLGVRSRGVADLCLLGKQIQGVRGERKIYSI